MPVQLHIGKIAQLLGVTPKTIRHYHKVGLLAEPARTATSYRLYTAQDLLRLHRIRRLQALGLSLKQIKAVLGEPAHEHSLRQVLEALDQELCARIAFLEERRQKIRALLAGEKFELLDALPTESPTFQLVQEQMAAYHTQINPALWQEEAQIYALFDNFHWSAGEQMGIDLKEMAQYFIQYYTEHPEEYQQLLVLGERLSALASSPEDDPEVEQLSADFAHYFAQYPFMVELQNSAARTNNENPITRIFGELMTPIFSPAQRKVLEGMARSFTDTKEGHP